MEDSNVLTAVFSNLAKAAEKQLRPRESGLFDDLAKATNRDYASGNGSDTSQTAEDRGADSNRGGDSQRDGADLAALRAALVEHIDTGYPQVNTTGASDRGVLRTARWGEKVTKAQRGLVDRYLNKGEQLLSDATLFANWCENCGNDRRTRHIHAPVGSPIHFGQVTSSLRPQDAPASVVHLSLPIY